MQLGKVIGTVVSTRKDDSLVGFKLLVVQIECPGMELTLERIVAVDVLGAGIGERVLVTRDDPARAGLPAGTPVDAAIVGIVDTVHLEE